MCDLLVDVEIEHQSFTIVNDDPVTVTCAEGRVIVAAHAHVGSTSTGFPVPVVLSDGALTDTASVLFQGAAAGHSTTAHCYLTTGRVATL